MKIGTGKNSEIVDYSKRVGTPEIFQTARNTAQTSRAQSRSSETQLHHLQTSTAMFSNLQLPILEALHFWIFKFQLPLLFAKPDAFRAHNHQFYDPPTKNWNWRPPQAPLKRFLQFILQQQEI